MDKYGAPPHLSECYLTFTFLAEPLCFSFKYP